MFPIGKVSLPCTVTGKEFDVECQVIDKSVPNSVLSLTDCVRMNLIKRVHSVHLQNENEVRNVKDIKLPQKEEECKQESAKRM